MIPTSLIGVALFVALLAPGFAYVLRHERSVPLRQLSALRETVRIVFVSLVCISVVGLTFALARWLWPTHTPDFGGLVRSPQHTFVLRYVQVLWWSIGLTVAATLLGAGAADPRLHRLIRRKRWSAGLISKLTGSSTSSIQHASAWYQMRHEYSNDLDPTDIDGSEGAIDVGLQLDDGSYLRGQLYRFNVGPEETADRDITLAAPLQLVTADMERHRLDSQFTIVSARRIVRMDVTHLPPGIRYADWIESADSGTERSEQKSIVLA